MVQVGSQTGLSGKANSAFEAPNLTTHHQGLGLFTDLYELTMAQAYFEHRMFAPATFSLFVRRYPPNRAYFIFAGMEDVLRYLVGLRFSTEEMDYLASTGIFSTEFLRYLATLRFTGQVWAIPEGRLFFCDEPVMEVTAPIIEAQIAETFIINQVNLQSLIATKASRCTWAAQGRPLVDFGTRRTHGTDAGLKAARASYIAGFHSTSNVLAGRTYGIPLAGTMAHSFVSSFLDELEAFRAFVSSFPDRSILLIDTYDTLEGARKAALVGQEMQARGQRLQGVRLDSGDMATLSKEVRRILDDAGLLDAIIFASGGLDEFEIEDLRRQKAPIDGFGVGTKMGVSGDAPWSDIAYKLVQYDGRPVLKLSTGKVSLPGEKQVYRFRDRQGRLSDDLIALRNEAVGGSEPLLRQVMEGGKITQALPPLNEIRETFRQEFAALPDEYKTLRDPPAYRVSTSVQLRQLYHRIAGPRLTSETPAKSPNRQLGES